MQPTPALQPTDFTLASAAEALAHPSPYRRREAVEALGQLDGGADLLFEALEDTNPWVRGAVAAAARRVDPAAAAGLVSVLLADRNPNVVVDALETVAALQLTQFETQVVLAATDATDQRVRAAAIRALGFLGSPQAAPIVAGVLTDPLSRSEPKVRIRASEVARALTEPALAEPLRGALADELERPEPHENLITSLCQALVTCDPEGRSGETLLAAVERVPALESSVCKTLARMGFEPARALFEAFAADPDPERRALGVRSLGVLGVAASWSTVLAAAQDPEPVVAASALRALGEAPVEGLAERNVLDLVETAARLAADALGTLRTVATHPGVAAPLATQATAALAALAALAAEHAAGVTAPSPQEHPTP